VTTARSVRAVARWACLRKLYVAAAFLAGVLFVGPAVAQQSRLSAGAEAQIRALLEEKAVRTPAQRKISSRLLYASKQRQDDPLMRAVPSLRSSVRVERDGTALVDIEAEVTAALLRRIEALGGHIESSFARFEAIRAYVPLGRIEALAESPEVRSIRPADQAITNKINTSQGDVAHRANGARANFAVDGSGTKICALSNGVDALAGVQGSGDLPAVDVLAGQAGSGFGTEGTAMLEIVFDLAPGADLGFATAFNGLAQFAQNILDLRDLLGCDVIVDDVFYFAEPTFQDGIIAQAVEQVVADGAVYFSSAGNSGNLNDGTAGVWEGDYADSGVDIIIPGRTSGRLHDFGGGEVSNQLTRDAPFVVTLQWSDPQGGSANDYDLCVLDSTLTFVFECSTNTQAGGQNPFEIIGPSFAGERLVVINTGNPADSRYLSLNTHRGRLALATAGQTSGHAAAERAFGVAAVDVATAGAGAFSGGAANPVELFSSDGPRRVFFEADGTPITPGDFSSTGGTQRLKPDVTAADGVATATPGFGTFFGTSAAAPHAAAIAGLLLSFDPDLTEADIRDVFSQTALDIEASGVDRDSGAGIVDALGALGALSEDFLVTQRTIVSAWRTVPLHITFENPVVIAGPPSFANKAPGVVALRRVRGDSFQARFQEWRYLDGKHRGELTSFLVMNKGRQTMADGSIWELGTLTLRGNDKWRNKAFTKRFPGRPELFLTRQTFNDSSPVTVRARNVTRAGFAAALFEEERKLSGGHGKETVGYLAVYSAGRAGTILAGTDYVLRRLRVKHKFKTALGSQIKLEEEKSKDRERRHARERVSIMRLGSGYFAQQVTDDERDTTAIRRRPPP
jgi:hypothetical protein